MPFFDLASLTKPLVTAPLALDHLDLDQDQRGALGLDQWSHPLTARKLLCHASGLPPWLPFTGEALAQQLAAGVPVGVHPLLREGIPGTAVYSDLGYRLLGELVEHRTGQDWRVLGAALTGLSPSPWPDIPTLLPAGPDAEAWPLVASSVPFPPMDPRLPHDANARAGMKGHAGFGASPQQMSACLTRWVAAGYPRRMAQEQSRAEDGTLWGLGLQQAMDGKGRLGQLLSRIPPGLGGVHVGWDLGEALPGPKPSEDPLPGHPTGFWMHFGFTGPALFVRPEDGFCLCLLLHRRGPSGELLDMEALRARRWMLLEAAVTALEREGKLGA